jgi:hypothetical protein
MSAASLEEKLNQIEVDSSYRYGIVFLRDRFLEANSYCHGEYVNTNIDDAIYVSSFGKSFNNEVLEYLAGLVGCARFNGENRRLDRRIDHESLWVFDYDDFFHSKDHYLVARLNRVDRRANSLLLIYRDNPLQSACFDGAENGNGIYRTKDLMVCGSDLEEVGEVSSKESEAFTSNTAELGHQSVFIKVTRAAWFRTITWSMVTIPSLFYGLALGFVLLGLCFDWFEEIFDSITNLLKRFKPSSMTSKQKVSKQISQQQILELSRQTLKVRGIARNVDIKDHSYTIGSSYSSSSAVYGSGSGSTDTYYRHYLNFRVEISDSDGGLSYRGVKLSSHRPFSNLRDGDQILVAFVNGRAIGAFNLTTSLCVHCEEVCINKL